MPPFAPVGRPAFWAISDRATTPSPRIDEVGGEGLALLVGTADLDPATCPSSSANPVTSVPVRRVMPMPRIASATFSPSAGSRIDSGVSRDSTTVESMPRTVQASAISSPM